MVILPHARRQMGERGISEEDIKTVLATGVAQPAKKGRKFKEMVFPYNDVWKGKSYSQKKVRVIYEEEVEEMVVITVLSYYGKWRV